MNKLCLLALLLCLFTACKKDKVYTVTATVVQKGGCLPTAWLITIDNPDPAIHTFLCSPVAAAPPTLACLNSAYILNLPDRLAQPGKKIKFSRWKDQSLLCFSSTHAPHHLEVTDIAEN